jgi:hypothetical protein
VVVFLPRIIRISQIYNILQRDFTIKIYRFLLEAFLESGYHIYSFKDWIEANHLTNKILILRHDIDKSPQKALEIARIEQQMGIASSYYFKIDRRVFKPSAVREIAGMGHEIGYHYEDLVKSRGNSNLAIQQFSRNLEHFRRLVPVVTICAEGSPRSRIDNRDLWKEYDYREFGIRGEPYLDIDYSSFLYLTDTGRIWNGNAFNVRDKVGTGFDYNYKKTPDIIADLQTSRLVDLKNSTILDRPQPMDDNILPGYIHLVTHPQRWHDELFPWARELVLQNLKNLVKAGLINAGYYNHR